MNSRPAGLDAAIGALGGAGDGDTPAGLRTLAPGDSRAARGPSMAYVEPTAARGEAGAVVVGRRAIEGIR
jgi:hypothetical protein